VATTNDEVLTTFRVLGVAEAVASYRRIGDAATLFAARSTEIGAQQQAAGLAFGLSAAALFGFARAAISAADDEVRLTRAAQDLKGSIPVEELRQWSQGLEDLTGVSHDRIADIAGILGTFQIRGDPAKELTLGILNASEALKALGLRGEQVANQVGKAIQTGNAGALRRAGIVIDLDQFKAAGSEAERTALVLQALQAQGGDAALTFRDSLPGAFQAFQSAAVTAGQDIGRSLVGPLRTVVEAGVTVEKGFHALPGPLKTTAALVGVTLAGAVAIYSGGTLLALNNTIRLAEAHFLAARGASAQAFATNALAGAQARYAGTAALGGTVGLGGGAATSAGTAFLGGGARGGGGGFFGTGAGRAAGAAGLIGLGLSFIPPSGNRPLDEAKDVASGVLTGAATGAFLGSLVPVIGTTVGAVLGGVAGGGAAFLTDQEQDRERRRAERTGTSSPELEALQKQNQLLQDQLDALNDIKRGQALPFSDLAGRDQISALLD
jgi:hypothetical protein